MQRVSRRDLLLSTAAAGVGTWAAGHALAAAPKSKDAKGAVPKKGKVVKNGRLKQSVSYWCYGKIPLPEFSKAVKEMGLPAIDLLRESEWQTVQDAGLVCSMAYVTDAGSIPVGFNDKKNHDKIVKALEVGLPKVAKFGWPNAIVFFGNRVPGMSDAEARDNCVAGLQRIKAVAEQTGVTVNVELLNSKVDHKGYQGDHAAWGLDVIKAVGSPKIKALFDIYHMQIMDGDIIRTIRDNKDLIGHYHTGGVPGRHELDDTQELNWRTVSKAILDMGFTGYVAHEFVPTRDPLTSLREAVALCDV
jgi:hydroxypyruvate isomerase